MFNVVPNLTDIWTSEGYAHIETIQRVIFPEGITYDWKNQRFLTSRVNCLLLLIPQLKKVSSTKKPREIELNSFPLGKSGWQDSNLRPPAPKAGAITGLRYTPCIRFMIIKNGSANITHFLRSTQEKTEEFNLPRSQPETHLLPHWVSMNDLVIQ